jgi:hypothetical protein
MQIVQPSGSMLPNQASAGVGAVIFDKPSLDAAQVQRNVDIELDNFARKKAADNAKAVADKNALIADLNFDAKGIFPDDKGHFQEGKNKLIEANQKLYSLEPNTQAFREAEKEAKRLQGFYGSEAVQSAEQWEQFKKIDDEFNKNPDKYDIPKYKEWASKVRLNQNPEARNKLFQEQPLVPKHKGWLGKYEEALTKKTVVPTEASKVTKEGGLVGVEKITTYTPDQITKISQSVLADPEWAQETLEDLNRLETSNPTLHKQVIDEANQMGIDPIERYSQIQLTNLSPNSRELSGMGETAQQKAYWADFYGSKSEEDAASIVVDQWSKLNQGDVNVYSPVVTGLAQDPNNPLAIQNYAKSDLFVNRPLGKYTVQQRVEDANKNIVTQYQTLDDVVLGNEFRNGVHYIKTTQSVYKRGKNGIDKDGWRLATDNDLLNLISNGSKDPSKALGATQKVLQSRGAYGNQNIQVQKVTPATPISTQRPPESGTQTAPKKEEPKKEGKTVSLQTIKSKVGTKGFEGYTEKELVDYYTSQGYKIQ